MPAHCPLAVAIQRREIARRPPLPWWAAPSPDRVDSRPARFFRSLPAPNGRPGIYRGVIVAGSAGKRPYPVCRAAVAILQAHHHGFWAEHSDPVGEQVSRCRSFRAGRLPGGPRLAIDLLAAVFSVFADNAAFTQAHLMLARTAAVSGSGNAYTPSSQRPVSLRERLLPGWRCDHTVDIAPSTGSFSPAGAPGQPSFRPLVPQQHVPARPALRFSLHTGAARAARLPRHNSTIAASRTTAAPEQPPARVAKAPGIRAQAQINSADKSPHTICGDGDS